MTVKIRPYRKGGWEIDIMIRLDNGQHHRERRKAPVTSKSAALRWGRSASVSASLGSMGSSAATRRRTASRNSSRCSRGNLAVELALERPGRPVVFASSRSQLRRDRDRAVTPLPDTITVLDKPFSTRRFDEVVRGMLVDLQARRAAPRR